MTLCCLNCYCVVTLYAYALNPSADLDSGVFVFYSRACIMFSLKDQYFKIAMLSHAYPFYQADTSRFPLINYTTKLLVTYIKLGEPVEISPTSFLN
jgi:hypothetical protein